MNKNELSHEFRELPQPWEVAVDIHNYNPRAHDGGAAIYLPDKNIIVALGAERVDRIKHSPDSKVAYDYLKKRLSQHGYAFGGTNDKFETGHDRTQPIHHHLSHAASAFYPSGFANAGVLVVDDRGYYGDGYNSTTIWEGKGRKIEPIEMNTEQDFPTQSIGHFYSGVTDYLGFGFLEAGKTMGLASYGKESKFSNWLHSFVEVNSDGSYFIDPSFSLAMRNLYREIEPTRDLNMDQVVLKMMDEIESFLGPKRKRADPILQPQMDLAWGVQDVLEKMMMGLARRTKDLTGSNKLCLAGGVALNSVANGKIVESGLFDEVFIQPASGDDGQALGKLLYRLYNEYGISGIAPMKDAYLGPDYSEEEINAAIVGNKEFITEESYETGELLERTANALSKQQIGGWHQGRSEAGPRALGHRSILADPRPSWMRDHINFQVKHREWFRPLAPSVPWERAAEYFDIKAPSPYMLVVSSVRAEMRDKIPAVTHVDGTARVQTVTQEDNGIYYDLIQEFGRQTGTPVLLNTSFNLAGEPIVETPEGSIKTFLSTKLDFLVMGNHFIQKK